MNETVFGIDFGTTNSLAALVTGDRCRMLLDEKNRPHPSVVWYRGSEVVVGREAKENMDLTESGAPPGFVRSPKTLLRRDGPFYIDGRAVTPVDAVAEVLKHLRADAARNREGARGTTLDRAVITIPVDFGGKERRLLRDAARIAKIGIVQFVHEPAAALYAYLRSKGKLDAELSRLEGQAVLVFDWGGGTLDLTLCRIQGGSIVQIASMGVSDIGGDKFDERLRNLVREKHAAKYGIDDVATFEQPGMGAKLLYQCEIVKIALSNPVQSSASVFIKNFLTTTGPARVLESAVSRDDLDRESSDLIRRGLSAIDTILRDAQLSYHDISLCLATGGMVNMPTIRNGLTERFLGRVPNLMNGDTIIAEGAAWIAHDNVRLTLSKPIELLVADSSGVGAYHVLVDAGWVLPIENQTQNVQNTKLFCIDPRDGRAVLEIAKPIKPGRNSPSDTRRVLCVGSVDVDRNAKPLIERIECRLQIDHDYVATLILTSSAEAHRSVSEFYDLDFALSLPQIAADKGAADGVSQKKTDIGARSVTAVPPVNVIARTNVVVAAATRSLRQFVPGDLAYATWPNYFAVESHDPTQRQREEHYYYMPCARCGLLPVEFVADGCSTCKIPPA
jgi:molecular chaperone DnaK